MNIKEKIKDLIKQATEEKSHFYTAKVLKEALAHIKKLEKRILDLKSANNYLEDMNPFRMR